MRTAHESARTGRRSRLLGAAALVVLALTTAAACQNGEGGRDRGTVPSRSADAPAPSGSAPGTTAPDPTAPGSPAPTSAKPAPPSGGTTAPSPGRGTASPGKGAGSGGSGGGGNAAPPCTGANLSVTSAAERQDSLRNLFLTAANTGRTTCTLYFHPLIRFDSRPEEAVPMESEMVPVVLKPGERAYAGVRLFREGEGKDVPTDAVTSMTLRFHSAEANTVVGKPLKVAFPDGGSFVNIDANVSVTYWNRSLEKVRKWTFAVH
ncbi:DUF4232 domain-containing protein (plasmid) [Streptomyces sp. BI20]|uniref:DUF4232 domain-containing protein n=1 Tax=Streptomyces sp. BI20 TaxID=3403460 RepID=UPI003C7091A9